MRRRICTATPLSVVSRFLSSSTAVSPTLPLAGSCQGLHGHQGNFDELPDRSRVWLWLERSAGAAGNPRILLWVFRVFIGGGGPGGEWEDEGGDQGEGGRDWAADEVWGIWASPKEEREESYEDGPAESEAHAETEYLGLDCWWDYQFLSSGLYGQ